MLKRIIWSEEAQKKRRMMVTVPEAGQRSIDENIGISPTAIRRLVNEGRIPVVMIGRKALINWQVLMDYLKNPPKEVPEPIEQGSIRRVGWR